MLDYSYYGSRGKRDTFSGEEKVSNDLDAKRSYFFGTLVLASSLG